MSSRLSINNLNDSAYSYPPSAWEDLAYDLEKKREWSSAMRAWRKAMAATAGHERRERYMSRLEQCLIEAQTS